MARLLYQNRKSSLNFVHALPVAETARTSCKHTQLPQQYMALSCRQTCCAITISLVPLFAATAMALLFLLSYRLH
jgi:hypothetical protein